MKHIISFSGGKDSTAMLLMMIEKKMLIDYILYFDTGWEFEEMYQHIDKLEKYIGMEIIRLKPKHDFSYLFDKWGFPSFQNRWCTAEKRGAINKFCNQYKPFTQYVGFAIDEAKRIKKTMGYCYPLVDWKITEKQALEYCLSKGFDWGGLYEKYDRVSCWNCPLQNLKELKALWKYYPEKWKQLNEMQEISKYQFRLDYTLEELDEKFRNKERQLSFT